MMSAWACVCGTAVGPDTRVRSFLIAMRWSEFQCQRVESTARKICKRVEASRPRGNGRVEWTEPIVVRGAFRGTRPAAL